MKSQAKVKQQRRIKNIPLYLGFRHRGLITHQIGFDYAGPGNRNKRNRMRNLSRRINRG